MKDLTVALAFIAEFGLVIASISIANDKCIEKKGGNTEYITEKFKIKRR